MLDIAANPGILACFSGGVRMHSSRRRGRVAAAVVGVGLVAGSIGAQAQSYPTRPVRVIVPLAVLAQDVEAWIASSAK